MRVFEAPKDWSQPKPSAEWQITEGAPPHGTHFQHPPSTVMALDALERTALKPSILTITVVADDATLRQWGQVPLAGFGGAASWAEPLFEVMASLGSARSLRLYLGCLDGQPVATPALLMAAGVAGRYFVATVSEVHGRGLAPP